MTENLVDRLREGAGHVPCDVAEAETVMDEAADEIERLRAALDIARSALLAIEQRAESGRASITRAAEQIA